MHALRLIQTLIQLALSSLQRQVLLPNIALKTNMYLEFQHIEREVESFS